MILIFGDTKCYENAKKIFGTAVKRRYMPQKRKDEIMSTFIPFYETASKEKMRDIVTIEKVIISLTKV